MSVVALVGCTSPDPYTGEQQTNNTTKGAVGGALAGAVLGAATSSSKDRGKGAAIGAVAGGAIGGGVGYYMDQQDAKLRAQLEQTGVRVVRDKTNNTIRLIMPGNITFQSGSGAIRSDFYSVLDSVALVLKEYNKTAVYVTGHTDNQGSYEMNQRLSEERAASVGSYLTSRGVASSRIHTRGAAYSQPIADNNTAAGREQNRRVEIELRPM
ncbi:MAG TPA: OmpA family protein [Pseudomonadales bacterium]